MHRRCRKNHQYHLYTPGYRAKVFLIIPKQKNDRIHPQIKLITYSSYQGKGTFVQPFPHTSRRNQQKNQCTKYPICKHSPLVYIRHLPFRYEIGSRHHHEPCCYQAVSKP